MSNNKQIEKKLKLPHRETVISTNTLQTKPFDNQKIEIMSNNKQSMKLYTEEEVVKLLDKYTVLTKIGAEFYLNKMTPIELPSDEELKKQFDVDEFDPYDLAYLGGAIRMRNLIQGGNND